MASISIEVGDIIREIWAIVTTIRDERTAEKDKTKEAQFLVYRSLALHPALDYMRPPSGVLADIDWYTELRSPFTSGIFKKLGQNEHFKRTSLLGTMGTRARIMMLLLWIIGHRLSEDQISRMLSTTIGDAIRASNSNSPTGDLALEVIELDSVKSVMVSLRKMIKTKLPISRDRNPFMGHDYNVANEDKALPRSELWGYSLPEDRQYEYDVRCNPSFLLQRLEHKVIIPQTKLTLLVIQWTACNFGLGKKIYLQEDIDPLAFWNADPPIEEIDTAFSDDDTEFSEDLVFDVWDGVIASPYEQAFDRPLEEWVHLRYCAVYPDLHNWAHISFIRVLLFNNFCTSFSLPSLDTTRAALHVLHGLQQKLPTDVLLYMQPFILARAFLEWQSQRDEWIPEFTELTAEKRGLTVIFSDALRWDFNEPQVDVLHKKCWFRLRSFMTDLASFCPDAQDILALPLYADGRLDARRTNILPLPKLNPADCTCGECEEIESRMASNFRRFRQHYATIATRECHALMETWEPIIIQAEGWLETLIARIETSFELFPLLDGDVRLGPLVLEVASVIDVPIGAADISDETLLQFIVCMINVDEAAKRITPVKPKPSPLGIGYVARLPSRAAPDREEYIQKDSQVDPAIFATGGWLFDFVGAEGVTVLHSRPGMQILYRTLSPSRFVSICMPTFSGDFPGILPNRHSPEWTRAAVRQEGLEQCPDAEVTLVLSRLKSDGFPLLSVLNQAFGTAPGALAVLIRMSYLGKLIETAWRPNIITGSQCAHSELWSAMLHCSKTANDIVGKIAAAQAYVDIPDFSMEFFTKEMKMEEGAAYELLKYRLEEYTRRSHGLVEPGAIFERNRASIIRCGVYDGPVDAIVILAASLKKRVYVIHRRECWDCAIGAMQDKGYTVGISIDTKTLSGCDLC